MATCLRLTKYGNPTDSNRYTFASKKSKTTQSELDIRFTPVVHWLKHTEFSSVLKQGQRFGKVHNGECFLGILGNENPIISP